MSTPNTLPVHERFVSLQGEGVHTGRKAFFIRLFGCPIKCPWCDSAGTWHPAYVPKQVLKLTVEELVNEARRAEAEFVVITGGEPAIHDLTGLSCGLAHAGLRVHIETSGHFPLRGMFDWVTLSPKRWGLPMVESIRQAHEIKIIVENSEDIGFYLELLKGPGRLGLAPNWLKKPNAVWLHPEWSKRDSPLVLNVIQRAILAHTPSDWVQLRAGYQLHKIYGTDFLDKRTQAPVPLGGDPEKGF